MFWKILFIIFILTLLVIGFVMYRKRKDKIKAWIYSKKRWLKHHIIKIKRKHYVLLNSILNYIILMAYIIIFMFSTLLILSAISVFDFSKFCFNFKNLQLENERFNYLWSQISISFMSTTVISLLSIFSNSYIYGEKQINVIFNKKSLFSIGKIFIYLMCLIIGSIICCYNETYYFVVFLNFIFTLYLVFYMLFRIILFYTHSQFFKYSLKSDYLKDERKHIKKASPLDNKSAELIVDLKYATLSFIEKNDQEYNVNINAIMNMLEISLYNNQDIIHQYYTELVKRTDLISTIIEIIDCLIKKGKHYEAVNLCAQLYNRLKYYRVVLVQSNLNFSIIRNLIKRTKYLDDDIEAELYCDALWSIIYCEIHFLYLYTKEIDYSKCRLYKYDMIDYFPKSDLLELLYINLKSNKYLSVEEKNKLFGKLYDNIRMMELVEKHPQTDIRHFKNKQIINTNSIEIPVVIKAEPIVMMFIKMIEEQDYENVNLFKIMNLGRKTLTFIFLVLILSLLEFASINKYKRKYLLDWILKKQQMRDFFIKTKIFRYKFDKNILIEIYSIIKAEYIDVFSKKTTYGYHPKLSFDNKLVDNVYFYIFKQVNETNLLNEKLAINENCVDEKIQKTITYFAKLTINNKKKK